MALGVVDASSSLLALYLRLLLGQLAEVDKVAVFVRCLIESTRQIYRW